MKDDGDILQNMNEQVSDLPFETQPVNTENLKGTAEKLLQEADAEEEKEGGFKEPQATNHDRMLTEEGGDVFEKHIVSEIQRHKSVVVLREESDEMREKQVGSSPLELAKKFNEKGTSATLQILGKSMLDHIQVFMFTYLLVLIFYETHCLLLSSFFDFIVGGLPFSITMALRTVSLRLPLLWAYCENVSFYRQSCVQIHVRVKVDTNIDLVLR
jgi:hypothetical protein